MAQAIRRKLTRMIASAFGSAFMGLGFLIAAVLVIATVFSPRDQGPADHLADLTARWRRRT